MKMPMGGAGFRFFVCTSRFFQVVVRPASSGFSMECTCRPKKPDFFTSSMTSDAGLPLIHTRRRGPMASRR